LLPLKLAICLLQSGPSLGRVLRNKAEMETNLDEATKGSLQVFLKKTKK
jgi:hypothetical protein